MADFTMKLNKLLFAVIPFMLLSAAAYSLGNNTVPEPVIERASEIAKSLGGTGTIVKAVNRAPNLPGLRQGTQVIYTDSSGALQNLIMLPDGIHFIAGPLGQFDPADGSISDAAGVKQIPAIPSTANTNAKSQAFRLDGILRPANFTSAGKELFENQEQAPESFMTILASAKGIKDGNGGQEVYVLFDPACGFCLKKYKELRPLIDAGKVTAYWIPVVGPATPPYTNLKALIDPGATNEEKLERLKQLTSRKPIIGKTKAPKEADELLKRTTTLLSIIRSDRSPDRGAGTPQMFYKTSDGVIHHQYGYSEDNIQTLISDIER